MNKYQTPITPCPDCYPIEKWEQMDDEQLQAAGLDPRNLPDAPGVVQEVSYPWLVVKCAGCGGVLAELDGTGRGDGE